MKPTLSKQAVQYLQGEFYEEQDSNVMDELFYFGAYYSWERRISANTAVIGLLGLAIAGVFGINF